VHTKKFPIFQARFLVCAENIITPDGIESENVTKFYLLVGRASGNKRIIDGAY